MAPKKPVVKKEEFVTVEQFKNLEGTINSLVDIVTKLADKPAPTIPLTVEEAKKEKAIDEVNAEIIPVNPAWSNKAKEIIGEALDRCEMWYPKRGGTIFTLIIKKEFSNAPADYIKMYKEDRRSREIGNEGIEGVEQWCKLVAQNLRRPQQK